MRHFHGAPAVPRHPPYRDIKYLNRRIKIQLGPYALIIDCWPARIPSWI